MDPQTDGPVRGTYRELPSCSDATGGELCVETGFDQRLEQLWIAPPNGLYGAEGAAGFVGAGEQGLLYRGIPTVYDDEPPRAGRRLRGVEAAAEIGATPDELGSIHDTQALLRGEAGTRVALDAAAVGT